MRFRTSLLLGAAFAAGIAAVPASQRLGVLLPAAFAQETNADTYNLLTLFANVFEKVRADYVDPVSSRDLVENALNGMLTGLDPHSNYMNAKSYRSMEVQTRGEFGGLGIQVTQDHGLVKVISPIDGTPGARAGIKSGDLITAVDGKTLEGLSLDNSVAKLRGAPGSRVTLTLKREGVDTPVNVSMTREVIHVQVVKARLEGNIAYIRLSEFTEQSDPELRAALTSLRKQAGGVLGGIVLDLRNNPGGLLNQAVAVSNDFLLRGEIVSTRARDPRQSERWDARPSGDISGGLPMVVLINGGSASASEIVAGALHDHHRAVLVGTRSFGKGSVQTVIPLGRDQGAIRLTTARYYTPSGGSIQGLGITPDVLVRSSREQQAHFGPERESDLNHTLHNQGGTQPSAPPPPRTDLPAVAAQIQALPPVGFPKFDPAKPETDYQLQQGLVVLRAMEQQKHAQAG